jgi:hypothetical protein
MQKTSEGDYTGKMPAGTRSQSAKNKMKNDFRQRTKPIFVGEICIGLVSMKLCVMKIINMPKIAVRSRK